jgi:hypothetical protein
MTSKENLKSICNYIESKQNITSLIGSPKINISFIEMLSNDDEIMLAQKKREDSDIVIDIALGEKNESEWSKRNNWSDAVVSTSDTNVVMSKLLTMIIGKSIYKNYDEVYDYIINFIDKNTNNPKSLINGGQSQQFNVKLSQGNYAPDFTDMEMQAMCYHLYHQRNQPDMKFYQRSLSIINKANQMPDDELWRTIENSRSKIGTLNKYADYRQN